MNMKQITIDDIRRITIQEIYDYVISKIKYSARIEENTLIIQNKKKQLKITIHDSDEYTCYNDFKWISISYINFKTLCGEDFGFAAKDFDNSIIDFELDILNDNNGVCDEQK